MSFDNPKDFDPPLIPIFDTRPKPNAENRNKKRTIFFRNTSRFEQNGVILCLRTD